MNRHRHTAVLPTSRRRQTAVLVLLVVLVILAVLVGVWLLDRQSANPDVEEDHVQSDSDVEHLVAAKPLVEAKLLGIIPAARPVQWGPHISKGEAARYEWPDNLRPDAALRVVFVTDTEGKIKEYDWVFSIVGEEVSFYGRNECGDGWKEHARRGYWPRNPSNHPPIPLP